MDKPFGRSDLAPEKLKLMRDGRFANARVYLFEHGGKRWTVKDFSCRSPIVRWFLAPYLLGHELKVIRRLSGMRGIAQEAFRIDRNALAIAYQDGVPLSKLEHTTGYPVELFKSMEELMNELHKRGVAHLDARGTGNWILGSDGYPRLIDFQAAVFLDYLPKGLRRAVEAIDISGVYKKWAESSPETMTEAQKRLYAYGQKCRSKWRFHGYFGAEKSKRHYTRDLEKDASQDKKA